VAVQLFASPRLKYRGIPFVNSTTPRFLVVFVGGDCWPETAKQPMVNAATSAAPVVMYDLRINMFDA
jgi:hypothetical protein